MGELNSFIVRNSITKKKPRKLFGPVAVPPRPPNLCPGCPHRGLFYNLARLDVFVAGDIGCYTLGFLPPLSAMDSCVCMGASIGMAHGMTKALGKAALGKIVAVIGDSTFCHSGITGLVNLVYNKSYATVIILDNRITGMTGHQPNPASGSTLQGDPAYALNLEDLCRAIGVKYVATINPHQINESRKILKREIERAEPSVVIARFPCVLLPEERHRRKEPLEIIMTNCVGCGACLKLGCPAIQWLPVSPEEALSLSLKKKGKQKGYSRINELCTGCGQCAPLCKFKAIVKAEVDI